jgi:hypothetical protein
MLSMLLMKSQLQIQSSMSLLYLLDVIVLATLVLPGIYAFEQELLAIATDVQRTGDFLPGEPPSP